MHKHYEHIKSLWSVSRVLLVQFSFQTNCRRHTRLSSARVSAGVKVGDKSCRHCDRSRVAEGKIVQTEHQTLPGGAKCFTNILPDFFVLFFLPFLLLFFCLGLRLVHQRLVPLWQKRKVNFSVALLIFLSSVVHICPAVSVSGAVQALLVIRTVHMTPIFCCSCVQSLCC